MYFGTLRCVKPLILRRRATKLTKMQPLQPKPCDPQEIALKSFFLGPQGENANWISDLLAEIFGRWVGWRQSLFPDDGTAISQHDQESPEYLDRQRDFKKAALELVTRFEGEVPKFSPRYVGHMFSEISLPALIGHIVTLLHNPNNISGESSRVGIKIEDEAIQALAAMVGFSTTDATGHFTSGGTVANLEALTRAYSRYSLWQSARAALEATGKAATSDLTFDPFRASHSGWQKFDEAIRANQKAGIDFEEIETWNFSLCNPIALAGKVTALTGEPFLGPVVLVPENMHYSWKKGCHLLGLGRDALWPIELDALGKLSVKHLEQLLEKAVAQCRPVLLVVSVVGTTELGGIDPVSEVQDLLDSWEREKGIHIWHHIDAAFGGFFRTLDLAQTKILSPQSLRSLSAVPRATSITLDPHKLGYVPYASGSFLTRDKRNYYFSTFEEAPYIDFDRAVDRGPFTLEGSRSAAGAVATWMTAKTMGLHSGGYGLLLERTTRIRLDLESRIKHAQLPIQFAPGCDTNVLCFTCAKPGESTEASNRRTLAVFAAFSPKSNGSFIVSKTGLRWKSYRSYLDHWTSTWSSVRNTDEVVMIRMCMMNPFFGSAETKVNYSDLFIECLSAALSQ